MSKVTESPVTLFDVSFDEITGKWQAKEVTSEYLDYLNLIFYVKGTYSITLDRENIGIAATDGYEMIMNKLEKKFKK